MSAPWSRFKGAARLTVMFVTMLMVASGLCGAQFLILKANTGPRDILTSVFMFTGLIELAVMAVSAVGAVLAAFAWGITALHAGFTSKD